ncbi:hypothetical protein [Agrobacterium rubi]|nr:hypothetical protein [Agrobacterium rubi]MBP1876743.1 uncharacterized protein YjiS (DUF1127 family) [Agrobacterium rubi]
MPSIFLINGSISFRLIECQQFRIVKNEAGNEAGFHTGNTSRFVIDGMKIIQLIDVILRRIPMMSKPNMDHERSSKMTMITHHSPSPSRGRLFTRRWLSRLTELVLELQTAWRRKQTLRALEALPADTLKDIGWPTTDSKQTRIVRR